MNTNTQARIDTPRTPRSRARKNGNGIVTSFWDLLQTIRDVSPEDRDDLVIGVITDLIESGKIHALGRSEIGIRRFRLEWSSPTNPGGTP